MSDRLMAQLHGARMVRYDTAGLLLAWFGGHGVHVYAADGTEVGYMSVGDFAENDASEADVADAMARYIAGEDDEQ